MPLSDTQRAALVKVREATLAHVPCAAESVEQRARRPEILPADLTVHIEIAPPSPHPHPILESTGALKAPERVPIYFYSLAPHADLLAENTHVIFHVHGGGNVTGHPTIPSFTQYYAQLLRALASQSGPARCILIAPSYRLAMVPENVFPAALQDLVSAYDYVLSKGYKASNIVISGDSAGGNHAVVLTHLILRSERSHPDGVIAIAPALIQTNNLLSDYAKSVADYDILDPSSHERVYGTYVGDSGVACTDPLVSGAFLPFAADWPRTLILVGDRDILIDGSRELQRRLAALGRPVELVEYDERPHGWWTLPEILLEDILDSAQRIARFVLQQ